LLTKVICVSGESYNKFNYFGTGIRFSSALNEAAPMTIEMGKGLKPRLRVNSVSRRDFITRLLLVWGAK
jgi:hypothetical protein